MSMLRTLCDEGHAGAVTLHPLRADARRRRLPQRARRDRERGIRTCGSSMPTRASAGGDPLRPPEPRAPARGRPGRWPRAETYVCGPPGLIESARRIWAEDGIERAAPHRELPPPSPGDRRRPRRGKRELRPRRRAGAEQRPLAARAGRAGRAQPRSSAAGWASATPAPAARRRAPSATSSPARSRAQTTRTSRSASRSPPATSSSTSNTTRRPPMSTTTIPELTPEQIESFGEELDAIRQRVVADLGERDAGYIRKVIRAQRGLEVDRPRADVRGLLPARLARRRDRPVAVEDPRQHGDRPQRDARSVRLDEGSRPERQGLRVGHGLPRRPVAPLAQLHAPHAHQHRRQGPRHRLRRAAHVRGPAVAPVLPGQPALRGAAGDLLPVRRRAPRSRARARRPPARRASARSAT